MNQNAFNSIQSAAADLDRKINQLQNSSGVLSDSDQQALTDIETASQQLMHSLADWTTPEDETAAHQNAIAQDQRVRPGETPEQHAARMRETYPQGAVGNPGPCTQQQGAFPQSRNPERGEGQTADYQQHHTAPYPQTGPGPARVDPRVEKPRR